MRRARERFLYARQSTLLHSCAGPRDSLRQRASPAQHCGYPSGGVSSSEGGGDQCPTSTTGYCNGTEPTGSWTEPYFFCDQFTNDTVQSPAMQQWPCASATWPSCGSGCVQSDACVQCFKDAHTWGENGLAWYGADCPSECYPGGW